MNWKANKANESDKRVMTGIIVAGLALTSLSLAGCEQLSASKVVELMSAPFDEAAYQIGAGQKPELVNKIVNNHNETFLVDATT